MEENMEENIDINPRTDGEVLKKKKINFSIIFAIICMVISSAFFVFTIVVTNIYQSATVVGTSMSPTINALALIDGAEDKNDIAYYTTYKTPKLNDIIIVDYGGAINGGRNIEAIKRLIAVGGDTICYYGGTLLRNGLPVDDSYLKTAYEYLKTNATEETADDWKQSGYNISKSNFESLCRKLLLGTSDYDTQFARNCRNLTYANEHIKYSATLSTYVLTIPEDYIFFLGDNRKVSNDCSYFGPVETKYLTAKVDFILNYDNNVFAKLVQEFSHIFA